jgi:F0F1-type ATP synthase epsilon subunit
MFKLTLRTPEETILETDVRSVHFGAQGGEMEVFEDHASLTANVIFTPVEVVEKDGKKETFLVRSGIFTFDNSANSATMLAMYCKKQSEVNIVAVKEYRAFIEKQLAEGENMSDFQILYLKGEQIAVEKQISESK